MSCNSCGTDGGTPGGCKNHGTCGTSGCNKLTVFDWLANMDLPDGQLPFNIVEVRFKNGRKEFFTNPDNLQLKIGDVVSTQAEAGHDIGIITLTGELVRVQLKRKAVRYEGDNVLPQIYRIASQNDVDRWKEAREKEEPMKVRARQLAIKLNLEMKISDIKFQGDGSKAVFYYTSEERVDFRQLIREYAGEFKTRIEMKQIGLRQEASRLGGIGSCGRELCCSTWLTDFRSVTTGAARYQNLSLNPQKLAGQCGKLKCCLNYELDSYMDALKDFPKQTQKLYTEKGTAVCQKIDIFKGIMWFCYEGEWMNWHTLTTTQIHEIMAKNKAKEPVAGLEIYSSLHLVQEEKAFENVVGQDSLTRFDNTATKTKRRKKRLVGNKQETTRDANAPAGTPQPKKQEGGAGTSSKPSPQRKKKPQRAGDRSSEQNSPSAKTDGTPIPERTSKPNDASKPEGDGASSGTNKPRRNNRNRNRPPKKDS